MTCVALAVLLHTFLVLNHHSLGLLSENSAEMLLHDLGASSSLIPNSGDSGGLATSEHQNNNLRASSSSQNILQPFEKEPSDPTPERIKQVWSSKIKVKGLPSTITVNSLPDWIADYVRLHNSTIDYENSDSPYKLKPGTKTLKMIGRTGGAGDRVKGIISGLYLAMCTNRTYLVDVPWNPKLETYFVPGLLQFHPQHNMPDNTQTILVGRGKVYETPNNESLIPPDQIDLLLKSPNMFQGKEKFFTHGDCTKRLQKEAAWRRGQTTWNEETDFVPLTAQDLFYYFFWTLFSFSPALQQRTEAMLASSGIAAKSHYFVSVHIRTGDTHFGVKNTRQNWNADTMLPKFYDCAQQLQNGLGKCVMGDDENGAGAAGEASSNNNSNNKIPIYIASDNPETKQQFINYDKTSIHQMTEMEIFHVDRSHAHDSKDPEQAAMDVWAEMKLLVDSTCIVYSRSGYSEIGAWTGSLPRCAVRFDECTAESVREALGNIGCG